MLRAPTLAGLLLRLAVRSGAVSVSPSLGPLEDDDAPGQWGDKEDEKGDDERGLFVYDVDEDKHWSQAGDSSSLITDIDSPLQRPPMDPEERARARAAMFVIEFMSELDVARSRKTGELLGLQLCMMEEFNPPKVCKVKKWGLVNEWNEKQAKSGHPEKQILVGDEISKCNNIPWHHNSKMFAKHISDQFLRSRSQGGQDTLELSVRRPKPDEVPDKRTQIQREHRHQYLYAKEWTPQLETFKAKKDWPWTRKPMEQGESDTMGWTLQHPAYWKPVTISSIRPHGLVFDWNTAHPEDKIVEGDELVHVDGYSWKHNTTLFMERITYIMHHVFSDGKILSLGIRRPREVQEAIDKATLDLHHLHVQPKKAESGHDLVAELLAEKEKKALAAKAQHSQDNKYDHIVKPSARADREQSYKASGDVERGDIAAKVHQEMEEISCSKIFHVRLSTVKEANPVGWHLVARPQAPARVSMIRDHGAVALWNAEQPEKIEVGDEILRVGNVSWKSDPRNFVVDVERVERSIAKGELSVPSLTVEVRRSWNETRLTAHGQQQKESLGSNYKSSAVASIRSKMEELASALSDLDSEDSMAIASELFGKAMKASVAASNRHAPAR